MPDNIEEKLIPVKVSSIHDLARIAASIITLGQPAYLVRFQGKDGKKIYGIIAVLRDYYKLYGLPMLYYYIDSDNLGDGNYLLVKVDDQGEHVELSKSTRPGWVAIPIIDLKEKPAFFPEEL